MKSKKLIETGGLEKENKPNIRINKYQDDIVKNIQVDNIIDDIVDLNSDIDRIDNELSDINTTISQLNHNDLNNRDVAGNHSKLIPSVNSTTAVQVTKADGTTVVMDFDTTNIRVGINNNSPKSSLDVNGGVKVGSDSDTATVDKVGTLRYYETATESYIDICMKSGESSYEWVNILTKVWGLP